MFESTTVTIEPSDKYQRVVGVMAEEHADGVSDPDDYEEWPEEHKEACDEYTETISNAPTQEELDTSDAPVETLSWDLISPSSDPDLVAKIATYFDGMSPDEPTGLLRAKCRLLDVDVYVQAQIAARGELRNS